MRLIAHPHDLASASESRVIRCNKRNLSVINNAKCKRGKLSGLTWAFNAVTWNSTPNGNSISFVEHLSISVLSLRQSPIRQGAASFIQEVERSLQEKKVNFLEIFQAHCGTVLPPYTYDYAFARETSYNYFIRGVQVNPPSFIGPIQCATASTFKGQFGRPNKGFEITYNLNAYTYDSHGDLTATESAICAHDYVSNTYRFINNSGETKKEIVLSTRANPCIAMECGTRRIHSVWISIRSGASYSADSAGDPVNGWDPSGLTPYPTCHDNPPSFPTHVSPGGLFGPCGPSVGNPAGPNYKGTDVADFGVYHPVAEEWSSWAAHDMIAAFETYAGEYPSQLSTYYNDSNSACVVQSGCNQNNDTGGTCTVGYGYTPNGSHVPCTSDQLGHQCSGGMSTVYRNFLDDIFGKQESYGTQLGSDEAVHLAFSKPGIELTQYQFDALSFIAFNNPSALKTAMRLLNNAWNGNPNSMSYQEQIAMTGRAISKQGYESSSIGNPTRASAAYELWNSGEYTNGNS